MQVSSNTLDDEMESRNSSPLPHRRNSISEGPSYPTLFLVDPRHTKARLLLREDTDGDERVTIDDTGPKHIHLHSPQSMFTRRSIRGNYMVSTLLQELALLDDGLAHGPEPLASRNRVIISESQLRENPVSRLNRMIGQYFWPALIRRVDGDGLTLICMDPKNRGANKQPRIYVPHDDEFAYEYFKQVAETRTYLDLEVIRLPKIVTAEYVCSINDRPGILSLDLEKHRNEQGVISSMVGRPFMVPGGRFNEMYGWDSYFAALGLLADPVENYDIISNLGNLDKNGNLYIAKSMVDNFVYQIRHYGKILNANRSYYLLRSQPPFLTDMAKRVYKGLKELEVRLSGGEGMLGHGGILENETADEWYRRVMLAAIKEYEQVWMSEPRHVPKIGLSRYFSEGQGVPPETEATHFDSRIKPYADKYGLDMPSFIKQYNENLIVETELDEYFCHDRAVRESGHDTTHRLDNCAANLLTIDLCSLLYKYEVDIAEFIKAHCGDSLEVPGEERKYSAREWIEKSQIRKRLADEILWNKDKGMYFDYDFKNQRQTDYESATTFWALWSGMASAHQAEMMVTKALPNFEVAGGIVSCTKASLGTVSLDHPNRQWDYPTGWAPHQILIWEGLSNYGYSEETNRIVYRWLYMMTRTFTDYNGVVPEKFNVVEMSHKVQAEYGNVGTDFKKVPREGFGWMNASYLIGQNYLTKFEKRALGALVPIESLLSKKSANKLSRVDGY